MSGVMNQILTVELRSDAEGSTNFDVKSRRLYGFAFIERISKQSNEPVLTRASRVILLP